MILQFSDLISKRERVKAIDYSFDMGCVDHEGEKIKATEPVKVKGNFSLDEGLLELNVDVDKSSHIQYTLVLMRDLQIIYQMKMMILSSSIVILLISLK
jgi:hypothetical protein